MRELWHDIYTSTQERKKNLNAKSNTVGEVGWNPGFIKDK